MERQSEAKSTVNSVPLLLGFKLCKGAGHIFAQDPRVEMRRHYGEHLPEDAYLEIRNTLHEERVGGKDGWKAS